MSDDRLAWILETTDQTELAARYDAWAAEYDADHEGWGWAGPARAVERLLALAEPQVVLDAGCGTGGVGAVLRSAGWTGSLIGVDLSGGMLTRAAALGSHDQLVRASLTHVPLADSSVDAYVATGVFTHGHVGAQAFPEAIRVVRPGGLIVLTVRDEVWGALRPEAERLVAAERWAFLERTEPTSFHPGKDDQDEVLQSVVVWRRT